MVAEAVFDNDNDTWVLVPVVCYYRFPPRKMHVLVLCIEKEGREEKGGFFCFLFLFLETMTIILLLCFHLGQR
jgi:hypothetical protein